MALVLIGFMGAGKSTAAAALAAARGRPLIDSDALLEARLGHSIAQEFQQAGEAAFRAVEEPLVRELLAGAHPRDVIALGGGAVLSEGVRAALREGSHLTALLHVDPAVAWERLQGSAAALRPLARDRDAFAALHAERLGLYEEVADVAMLWARAPAGEYPVIVAPGLLGDPERLAALWPLDPARSRPFCVSDTTVAGLYGDRLAALARPRAESPVARPHEGSLERASAESALPGDARPGDALPATVLIEPGEAHKTLAGAERVWSALAAAGMTRADHIVALGGGVVGDLAGFCAATYQRGVPIVHVPTTLVAQVDSAYGGKTGIDLPAAKNYVGAYHQPAGVLVDPDTLATLPPAELAAGWVEVLKTALIAGGELWERVAAAAGSAAEERTILDCAAAKLAIVAADERDAGARQALNLGHTVGHAIETATGYARYRHGEAVGLGLLAALRLSDAPALREQVRELLLARGLPVTLAGAPGPSPAGREGTGGSFAGAGETPPSPAARGAVPTTEEILAAAARDKKRLGEDPGVPFVLLSAPGAPRVGCHVPISALRAAVSELTAP